MRARPALAGACLVGALAALSACGTDSPDPTPPGTEQTVQPTKNGDGVVKTDLVPITSRVPGLAGATSARWTSGTLGDDRVPGPSTYWIDAVLTLPADEIDRLRAQHATEPADAPDIAPTLQDELPDGDLETSVALDESLAHGDWRVRAYVAPASDQLVVLVTGQ